MILVKPHILNNNINYNLLIIHIQYFKITKTVLIRIMTNILRINKSLKHINNPCMRII